MIAVSQFANVAFDIGAVFLAAAVLMAWTAWRT